MTKEKQLKNKTRKTFACSYTIKFLDVYEEDHTTSLKRQFSNWFKLEKTVYYNQNNNKHMLYKISFLFKI